MRAFAARVAVLSGNGEVFRHVHGELARALVDAGNAAIENVNGRIKSIRLIESAATCAERIGPPSSPNLGGVRFSVREKLDCGGVAWRHHGRSTDYE